MEPEMERIDITNSPVQYADTLEYIHEIFIIYFSIVAKLSFNFNFNLVESLDSFNPTWSSHPPVKVCFQDFLNPNFQLLVQLVLRLVSILFYLTTTHLPARNSF